MAAKLKVKLEGDNSDLNKKIKSTDREVKKLEKSAKRSAAGLRAVGSGVAIAIGVAAVAIRGLIGLYKEQEQAEIRTRRTLEATGFAAGLSAKEIFKMASALQEVTTFGDETIIAGQNLLLTFRKIGADTFPRATEAMLDMSTAMGTGLKESAIQLGKALNDPTAGIAALSRVGITFSAVQKNLIKDFQQSGQMAKAQGVILTELEAQFGGAARAAAQGTGNLTQIGNVMGDIAEKAGGVLFEGLSKVAGALNLMGVAQFWDNYLAGVTDAGKGTADLKTEIAKLEGQMNILEGNIANNADSAFAKFTGKYAEDINDFADFSARKVKLVEILTKREKEEYKNSAAGIAEIKAKADAADAVISAEKEKRDKAIAAKVIGLRVSHNEKLEELKTAKKEGDLEGDALELETLQLKLENEALLKTEAQATELSDKGKHAQALALIDSETSKKRIKTLQDEEKNQKKIVAMREATLGRLASLATSNNSLMKGIGKAASLVQIGIATKTGAIEAYKSLAGIPIVGPGLGITAAAALTTFGLEQARSVTAMAQGGLVEGGIPGVDSVPLLAQQGETVIPAKTSFQDIVDAGRVVSGDNGDAPAEDATGGEVRIVIDAGMFTDAIEGEFVTRSRENRTAMQVG